MMRAYSYHAFAPRDGVAEFELAVTQRRDLWTELAEIEDRLRARCAALMDGDIDVRHARTALAAAGADKIAVKAARKALRAAENAVRQGAAHGQARKAWTEDVRRARAAAAVRGLHWGSYNDVVSMFRGAAAAGAPGKRGQRGERVTLQFQGGVRAGVLFASGAGGLTLTRAAPRPPADGVRKRGSRRDRRHEYAARFLLRSARNPLGPAALHLNVLIDRPVPRGAVIKMAHVDRLTRPVVTKDGAVHDSHRWRLTLICDVPPALHAGVRTVGVALVWGGDDQGDEMTFAVVAPAGGRVRDEVLPVGWADWWARRAALFARADETGAPADAAAARIYEKRLFKRRRNFIREFAAAVARRYAVIGIQAIDYRGMGVKGHAAPAVIRLELKRAIENAGGTMVEVSAAKWRCHGCGREHRPTRRTVFCVCGKSWRGGENLARALAIGAERAFSEDPSDAEALEFQGAAQ